ncbi:MAG: NACHT domain-containing protein [Catenulispora sp.]|nr:NACHT domain-containing protein [Catenulispora sp.]
MEGGRAVRYRVVVRLWTAHVPPTLPAGGGGSGHLDATFWTAVAALAGALGLGGLAALSVKQLITPSLNRAGASFADVLTDYLAVLRSRSLRRIRRYQRSVGEYAGEHTLGFGTEPISVRDVYVPLAAEGTDERRDLYETIRRERRSVVIGEAGAGKSMLLKHSLLEWTERRTTRRSEIPVLVELRRLNAVPVDAVDLVAQVQQFLEMHRFKGAAGFATKALEDGRISVLFDGLDEVTADRLDGVVQKLKDFAQRFTDCQIVVTCRSSLYKGELEFKTVVRVAELDDATIRRLLYRWPGLDAAAQERLYRNIGSNASLKRLARSPLLLSMMAWMTMSGIVLPTSRAEFYDTAIENLVKRDDVLGRGRSQFAPNKKLAVLRGIALILQDRSGTDEDRLTISHARALEYVRSVATSIDLDQKDAEPLVTEIVERSELLATNGGVAPSYFFRHLTFQEYLAAVELRDDRDGLLERYVKDPNAWRETVKLWCGKADRDATPLIRYLIDAYLPDAQLMALECASVTTKVDEEVVLEAADRLQVLLVAERSSASPGQAAITFGNAAAGNGPRSALIRNRLFELAQDPDDPVMRVVAMRALAVSGHESAAAFLAARYTTDQDARMAMLSMGDMAVPALREMALRGAVTPVDDLALIGTPSAVDALVEVLALSYRDAAVRAAWRLAERLDDTVAVKVIAQSPHVVQIQENGFLWVWQRFSGGSVPLMKAVARIFELIDTCEIDQIPSKVRRIDFRFVIASIVVDRRHAPLWDAPRPAVEIAEELIARVRSHVINPMPEARIIAALQTLRTPNLFSDRLCNALLDHYKLPAQHVKMFCSLSHAEQMSMLRLLGEFHSRSTWTAMTTTTPKKPRGVFVVNTIAVVLTVYAAATAFWRELGILIGDWSLGSPNLLLVGWVPLVAFPLRSRYGLVRGSLWRYVVIEKLIPGIALAAVCGYHAAVILDSTARWIGWAPTWILLAGIGIPTGLLWLHNRRRNERYNNPLRQAIEAVGATSPTTSIIATSAQP